MHLKLSKSFACQLDGTLLCVCVMRTILRDRSEAIKAMTKR